MIGSVLGAEAIDEDAFAGGFGDGDDGGLEVPPVVGDDAGGEFLDDALGDFDGDGFGHADAGVAELGERFHEGESAVDDGAVEQVVLLEGGDDAGGVDAFGVKVDLAFAAHGGEGLIEGGDADAREAGEADFEGLELGEGEIGDFAIAVGHAIDGAIVHEDEVAILGGADVDFDIVGAGGDGGFNGGNGVLGVGEMFAAVRDDLDVFGSGGEREGGEGGEHLAAVEHGGDYGVDFSEAGSV